MIAGAEAFEWEQARETNNMVYSLEYEQTLFMFTYRTLGQVSWMTAVDPRTSVRDTLGKTEGCFRDLIMRDILCKMMHNMTKDDRLHQICAHSL